MKTFGSLRRISVQALSAVILISAVPTPLLAAIMLSGNENKIDLTGGAPRVVPYAAPDTLTVLEFTQFPPVVTHLTGIVNSVIGPPSNIAISPDGRLALIANSIRVDSPASTNWTPETHVHLLDLTARPPRVVGRADTDLQPSGISFVPGGRFALVANRAAGTISVLAVEGSTVREVQRLKVCEPAESVSDVAVSPDGRLVLASVQKGGYLAVLRFEHDRLELTPRKISTFGQPYRVVIAPDSELAFTAGAGFGNGLDEDALTVVHLKANPMRAVDYLTVGAVPESLEVSPDGRWVAVVVMNGSNLAPGTPGRAERGGLVIFERRGRSLVKRVELPVGRIPEGVAFTPDSRQLVVQCHPDRELWLFTLRRGKWRDTNVRIAVPGLPSSLRAGP